MAELDREEAEILEALESGKTERAKDADELLRRHRDYAEAALRPGANGCGVAGRE